MEYFLSISLDILTDLKVQIVQIPGNRPIQSEIPIKHFFILLQNIQ